MCVCMCGLSCVTLFTSLLAINFRQELTYGTLRIVLFYTYHMPKLCREMYRNKFFANETLHYVIKRQIFFIMLRQQLQIAHKLHQKKKYFINKANIDECHNIFDSISLVKDIHTNTESVQMKKLKGNIFCFSFLALFKCVRDPSNLYVDDCRMWMLHYHLMMSRTPTPTHTYCMYANQAYLKLNFLIKNS